MTLVRFNLTNNLSDLRSNMDRLFTNFFDQGNYWPENSLKVVPAVNLEETEDAFKLSAELPGIDKKDISITLENNVLCIKGEKKSENEDKGKNYHRMERSYGKFQRAFELPGTVNREKIEADFKNGILNISVPKAEEAKPKQIEIKVK